MQGPEVSRPLAIADAIVVGSGAAGGWAAKELTEADLRVLLLETRVPSAARRESRVHWWPKRLFRHALGHQPIQKWHTTYWTKDPDLFIKDREFPYSTPPDKPFMWIRGGQPGGRSLLWGRVTLRLSDAEFTAAERDGHGIPWPIGHRDLSPYYDRVERFFRIHSTHDGLPQVPDGTYYGAGRGLTRAEQRLGSGIANQWNEGNASSIATTIPIAQATGLLTIRTGAAVSHLIPNRRSGRVGGVLFIDATTGRSIEAHARLVFLCASTIESVRILLQTTGEHSELPITESDCLGRYLMDQVTLGTVLEIDGVPFEHPAPLSGADSFLIPRFQNLADKESYLRGYGMWGAIQKEGLSGRRGGPALGQHLVQGEMLPYFENHVTLNGVAHRNAMRGVSITCAWGENERRMHAAMTQSVDELLTAAGGRTCLMFDRTIPGPWRFATRLQHIWRAAPPVIRRFRVLKSVLVMAAAMTTECAGMAVNMVADTFAGDSGGEVFLRESDPKMVAASVPVFLKLYESIRHAAAANAALNMATGRGFVSYAGSFVQRPADRIPNSQIDLRIADRERAKPHYMRGAEYVLTGLELKYPGVRKSLEQHQIEAALANVDEQSIDFLFWIAAAGMGAISTNPFDLELLIRVPIEIGLMEQVRSWNDSYNHADVHDILIGFYGGGGNEESAHYHFSRAVEISVGTRRPRMLHSQALSQFAIRTLLNSMHCWSTH